MNSTIKVIGSQNDGEKPVVVTVKGNHYNVDDKHFIEYVEVDEESGVETLNKIEFHKDKVTIDRVGAINYTMIFQRGKTNVFHYETGYGNFEITIRTNVITIYNEGDYIRFNIEYQLESNGERISENSLIIEVSHE